MLQNVTKLLNILDLNVNFTNVNIYF